MIVCLDFVACKYGNGKGVQKFYYSDRVLLRGSKRNEKIKRNESISFHQPRSQGLSSYRLGRARRDPGWVWSRVSQNLGDDN